MTTQNSVSSKKSWPTYNSSNFSKFQKDNADKRTKKTLSLYISTKDNTPQQVIKKDRSNILLRYLFKQRDKKNTSTDPSKRKVDSADDVTTHLDPDEPRRKVSRNNDIGSIASSSTAADQLSDQN